MQKDIQKIKKYVRAANYLTAIQIYLQENFLLEQELSFNDIKPRLLGHWGTCPGINFIYANLNYLVKKHSQSVLFVLGPGHGFPALQANLFLEGTLQKYYPEATRDTNGIGYIAKNFSWPYGFPSHSNPQAPGVIVEGGELGYALSTAYGAVLDNPDLIAACVVGDGEAETGPTATAWHLNKFIDPATNGAVLPILHLNGYKISGPTIFGRMDNEELSLLFYGYGYKPIIVEEKKDEDIYKKMIGALDDSYELIRHLQVKARKGEKLIKPRFPLIILKTPKGWTGIKKLDGEKIEGNNLSHQVVGTQAKTDQEQLESIEKWLQSYKFNELFDQKNGFDKDILDIIPKKELCLGENKHTFPSRVFKELKLPDLEEFSNNTGNPEGIEANSMRSVGKYLSKVFKLNGKNKNFRFFSPDETYSNKLDEIFKSTTRALCWPIKSWDKDISPDGRVIEMLSEHSLQGLIQGYLLTGRHGIFASYEAFIQIVSSMADQYAKFLKVSREISWRQGTGSLNYILTSSGWRQDHNGFSHQNPGFIGELLEKQYDFIKTYFPPDANTTLVTLEKCLDSKDGINIIIAGKTDEPQWLSLSEAKKEVDEGILTWDFASDDNPHVVFCGIGDYMTKEVLAAISIIKKERPDIQLRFVSVLDLTVLSKIHFEKYFTQNQPVIFNFHGYPDTLKKLLFDRPDTERFSIRGYTENGSTTTPFDMHVRNKTSRYHLVIEAYSLLAKLGFMNKFEALSYMKPYEKKLEEHKDYIIEHGVDMPEIVEWKWER